MAQGWGRSTWGDGPFGQPAGTTVDVTGVSATSALGNEGILTDQILAVTQSTLTTTLGTVVTAGAAVTGVTGNAQVGTLGDETVAAGATVAVTGVAGTTALGTVGFGIFKQ